MLGIGKRKLPEDALDALNEDFLREQEEEVAESGKRGRKQKQEKVPNEVNVLTRVVKVDENFVVERGERRFAVWRVNGADYSDDQVTNGWSNFLNSLEFPVQVLIRQHIPDLGAVRQELLACRPDHMRVGKINEVGDSLLNYLQEIEETGTVVDRRWYVIAQEEKAQDVDLLLYQGRFSSRRVVGDELKDLVRACTSGMVEGHRQETYQLKEYGKFIELNHRYAATYDIHKWPRQVSLMFLDRLMQMGEEMDLSFWYWPVTQRESHSRLQMQLSRFIGARMAAEQKGKLVPPEVDLVISDVTRLSSEVERGVNRLFRITATMTVFARDRDRLKRAGGSISGYFRSSLAGIRLLRYRQGKGFAAVLPALRRGVGDMYLTDAHTLLRLFPFGPPDLDKRTGTLFGVDLRSRTPVMYNPFHDDEMNAHMVVMARSGAGKSFLTKLRVLREALRDVVVYLIDPEGEYSVITEALGGRVLIPGSPGYGLNPFSLSYTNEGDLTTRVAGLGSLVEVMLSGEVDVDRRSMIDRCLTAYYDDEIKKHGRNPGVILGGGGMDGFYDFLLYAEEQLGTAGSEMARLLARFSVGSLRYLMSSDGVDLSSDEKPVTCFNLKNLSSQLKPVATSVCAEVVWGLAVAHKRPRLLIVDECWTVLATPSGAAALITIVKRARKYGLGLMTITQDVQDFLGEHAEGGAVLGHAGKSLLQNSATKLALSQDPAALPAVIEALALGDDAASFLRSALRGQGLFITNSGVFPLEIISTAAERELLLDDTWKNVGEELPAEMVMLGDEPFEAVDVTGSLLSRVQREHRDMLDELGEVIDEEQSDEEDSG